MVSSVMRFLRVVEQQVVQAQRERREAAGVGREQIAQVHPRHRFGVALERPPGGGAGQGRHGRLLYVAEPFSAAAARASSTIRGQSPAATASPGATQEPPTQSTFAA